jgi:hypothetical protein
MDFSKLFDFINPYIKRYGRQFVEQLVDIALDFLREVYFSGLSKEEKIAWAEKRLQELDLVPGTEMDNKLIRYVVKKAFKRVVKEVPPPTAGQPIYFVILNAVPSGLAKGDVIYGENGVETGRVFIAKAGIGAMIPVGFKKVRVIA